jgi:hypothetical protein
MMNRICGLATLGFVAAVPLSMSFAHAGQAPLTRQQEEQLDKLLSQRAGNKLDSKFPTHQGAQGWRVAKSPNEPYKAGCKKVGETTDNVQGRQMIHARWWCGPGAIPNGSAAALREVPDDE